MVNLLWIRFVTYLDYKPFEGSPFHPHGALFTRWLPDGEKDSIELDPQTRLKIWFDRFGFVDDQGFARYDIVQRQLDPSAISRQGRLESGPLFGRLRVTVDDPELAQLRDECRGDERYVRLGKRIIKELIIPQVKRFIGVLRTEYGQYWISELGDWDSRTESLGSYCSKLQMRWSLDGTQWKDFLPDDNVKYLGASLRNDFDEYMTESSWRELQSRREWPLVTEGARMLTRAHESLDQGDLKEALINGVTALELAIDESLRSRISHELLRRIEEFKTINLPAKMIILAAPLVNEDLLAGALAAVEVRNRIVHDGLEPEPTKAEDALKLLRIVSALLGIPNPKFPSTDPRNAVFAA